jgi:hypothetical protein
MTEVEKLIRHQSAHLAFLQWRMDKLQACVDSLACSIVVMAANQPALGEDAAD